MVCEMERQDVSPLNEVSVLVLATAEGPVGALQRMAARNGWTVRQVMSARAGYSEILRSRPRVAVIQVSLAPAEALELIRLGRTVPIPVLLVAVAKSHSEDLERAVRIAGVDGYLGDPRDGALLERTVAELLVRQKENTAPVLRTGRGRIHRTNNLLLLSSSSRQEPRVAGLTPPPPVRQGGWHEPRKTHPRKGAGPQGIEPESGHAACVVRRTRVRNGDR